MSERYEQANETVRRICEALPDDPLKATVEVMTAAALVAVSAGYDDARAVSGFCAALRRWREQGVGEERH